VELQEGKGKWDGMKTVAESDRSTVSRPIRKNFYIADLIDSFVATVLCSLVRGKRATAPGLRCLCWHYGRMAAQIDAALK